MTRSTPLRRTRFPWACLGLVGLAAGAAAQSPPAVTRAAPPVTTAAPEDVGLSGKVLARIGPTIARFIQEERTGGVLTLVARHGKIVYFEPFGLRAPGDPLEREDIFRVWSMTKPITSVAAMILVEEGRLSLDDPVARYIPAFAGVQVWDDGTLRPPSTEMTIRHLMTHTSGLTYGLFGNTPVDQMYRRELDLSGTSGRDLAATVDVIASLPLVDDPGSRWTYSVSTDVLGRVIEVASGLTLETFFQERILGPLGMVDTGFGVPEDQRGRLASMYAVRDGALTATATGSDGSAPDWFSGGGGLYSTAVDYFRFCSMLLGEGELDGVRILRPETVRDMRRNQLPASMIPIGAAWPDTGYGLGFAVSMTEHAGRFFWLGVANTYFWIDPTEDLVTFAWTQFDPVFGAPVDRLVTPIVYEAIQVR